LLEREKRICPQTLSGLEASVDMMEIPMRRVSLLLFCFAAAFGPLPSIAADLASVRSVYILQMPRGMDQYLANRLTNDHIFLVVTDPKRADAMLTDQIGAMFEEQLETLLPSPEPVKKVAPPANDKDKPAGSILPIDKETKLPTVRSTFAASKGTLFLVDPKSHQVLWSVYDPPKASDSKEMDRTASDIVNRLKKVLNTKR
jgi:hypothetical protein